MARPRKALVEGAVSAPAPKSIPVATVGLSTIVESFKAAHPELWEELALCPLQHGLDTMIEKLKH